MICFFFQVANIIYLDQPVGTGFSYSRNPLADIPSDTGVAKRVEEFLRKVKGKLKLSVKGYVFMHRLLKILLLFVFFFLIIVVGRACSEPKHNKHGVAAFKSQAGSMYKTTLFIYKNMQNGPFSFSL